MLLFVSQVTSSPHSLPVISYLEANERSWNTHAHAHKGKERKDRRTREQNHDYFCNFKVSILKKWNNMLLLGLNCDRASSDDCTDISWSSGLNYRLSTHLFNKLEVEEFNSWQNVAIIYIFVWCYPHLIIVDDKEELLALDQVSWSM